MDSCHNVVRIVLYLRLFRAWPMLTPISAAGTETVRKGSIDHCLFCSCCVDCYRDVMVHAGNGRIPRGAKEVPRGTG